MKNGYLNTIEDMCKHDKVIAIGETGLDYYHPAPEGWSEEDYDLPVWAGVVSLGETVTRVQEDPRLRDGIERPASVEACLKPSRETAGA